VPPRLFVPHAFVADGVVTTDGAHHPADVICYATGFRHNDYLWPMTITGRRKQEETMVPSHWSGRRS